MDLDEETGGNTEDSCGCYSSRGGMSVKQKPPGKRFPQLQSLVQTNLTSLTVLSWEGNCVTSTLRYFSS